jgi:hypothetical protein
MGFFDDDNEDPFEDIVKQFFGENNINRETLEKIELLKVKKMKE